MFTGCGVLLASVALWFAPPALVAQLRSSIFDTLRPGLVTLSQVSDGLQHWQIQRQEQAVRQLTEERDQARSAAAQAERRLQRLTIQLTQMAAKITNDRHDGLLSKAIDSPPALFLPALVEARVIGDTLSQEWRAGRLLAGGWQQGIREESLVLRSERPLIDVGQPEQLTAEDTLLVGSQVVGKVEVVGRWTSTYVPLTDPDFRASVQLLRPTEAGPVWGATGILQGTGTACELTGILAEASVRPGDLICAAQRDGIFAAPLLYGSVTAAHLELEAREWDIAVTPAAPTENLDRVRVLRAALNPQRIWGN